ncbi:MAG: argininosuccinate synthase [Coriobacteriia bacterium]|nr:argininosuccinate synthase [Coriobacteriia bacterium]
MSKGICILAYSGGLDTSVCIRWIIENYHLDVIACVVDVGQEQDEDLDAIQKKALQIGAVESLVLDVKDEFAHEYVALSLMTNGMYENKYPLVSALSRPLISKRLVALAQERGANYIAHGCTGKGNDQVRFETSIAALDPSLTILGPVREWDLTSREAEMDYAEKHGIPVPTTKKKPYSVDDNMVGRAIECGVLEDPNTAPPEDVYTITQDPKRADAPDEELVTISFEGGLPTAINGEKMSLVDLLVKLNLIAGPHGVGRIDMVENRLIGVKSREIYEAPGMMALITAHKSLEELTLERETMHFKLGLEQEWSRLVYFGKWFSPLKQAIDAFIASTQTFVTGDVRLSLYRGNCVTVGRTSPYSLYDFGLATYDSADQFNHKAAKGFMELYSLPIRVWAQMQSGLHDS